MEVVYTSFIGVFDQKIVHDESEFDVPRHAEFDRATCGVKEQRRTDFLWREPIYLHVAFTLVVDDFLIKYPHKAGVDHLHRTLNML